MEVEAQDDGVLAKIIVGFNTHTDTCGIQECPCELDNCDCG